jgi:hypothetical protein
MLYKYNIFGVQLLFVWRKMGQRLFDEVASDYVRFGSATGLNRTMEWHRGSVDSLHIGLVPYRRNIILGVTSV